MVPDDAEAVSALRRATFSYSVMSPASTRHLIEVHSPAEKFLGLVAISGRDLVAWGATGLNTWTSEEGQAGISIYVHPEHRRQGIADALAKPLHDHLAEIGAVRARASPSRAGSSSRSGSGTTGPGRCITPGSIRGCCRSGRRRPRGSNWSRWTPSMRGRPTPRTRWRRWMSRATPADAIDFDDWVREVWESPALGKSLGVAAMAGDEVAAFSAIETDGDRAWSAMTDRSRVPRPRASEARQVGGAAALRRRRHRRRVHLQRRRERSDACGEQLARLPPGADPDRTVANPLNCVFFTLRSLIAPDTALSSTELGGRSDGDQACRRRGCGIHRRTL